MPEEALGRGECTPAGGGCMGEKKCNAGGGIGRWRGHPGAGGLLPPGRGGGCRPSGDCNFPPEGGGSLVIISSCRGGVLCQGKTHLQVVCPSPFLFRTGLTSVML